MHVVAKNRNSYFKSVASFCPQRQRAVYAKKSLKSQLYLSFHIIIIIIIIYEIVGSAGFEPAASSAQGWHHTKLDNDPAR
jgi:hypothetical protein